MERLTTKSLLGGWTLKVPRQEGVDRLAAYEDTGLEPDTCAEYKKFEDEIVHNGVCFQHVLDLLEAEGDGRCVVLPCKGGDDVFSFRWNIKTQKYEVCAGKIKNVRYDTVDCLVMVSDGERYCVWGKSAFPTRSAAEAALKAGEPQ